MKQEKRGRSILPHILIVVGLASLAVGTVAAMAASSPTIFVIGAAGALNAVFFAELFKAVEKIEENTRELSSVVKLLHQLNAPPANASPARPGKAPEMFDIGPVRPM